MLIKAEPKDGNQSLDQSVRVDSSPPRSMNVASPKFWVLPSLSHIPIPCSVHTERDELTAELETCGTVRWDAVDHKINPGRVTLQSTGGPIACVIVPACVLPFRSKATGQLAGYIHVRPVQLTPVDAMPSDTRNTDTLNQPPLCGFAVDFIASRGFPTGPVVLYHCIIFAPFLAPPMVQVSV